MHQWTRSFFGAHAFRINSKKTKFFSSQPLSKSDCTLPSVDGRTSSPPLPSSTLFRYLGVIISMDLDWSGEMKALGQKFWVVRASILSNSLGVAPAVDAINCYLMPRMEMGLRLVPLTPKNVRTLDRWRGVLQDAILNATGAPCCKLSRAAFCVVTGMEDFTLFARRTRAASAYVRLCIRPKFLRPTGWHRLATLPDSPLGTVQTAKPTRFPTNRLVAAFSQASTDCLPLRLSLNEA